MMWDVEQSIVTNTVRRVSKYLPCPIHATCIDLCLARSRPLLRQSIGINCSAPSLQFVSCPFCFSCFRSVFGYNVCSITSSLRKPFGLNCRAAGLGIFFTAPFLAQSMYWDKFDTPFGEQYIGVNYDRHSVPRLKAFLVTILLHLVFAQSIGLNLILLFVR